MIGLRVRLAGVAALGLIGFALSELAFYPVAVALDLWVGILAYGLLGWAAVAALGWAARWDARGLWLAAGLFGFLAEGIVVGELYAALPLTLVWTSLAWHGGVTVWAGFIGLSGALARGPIAAGAASAALGGGLGLWGAWMWAAEGGGGVTAYAGQIGLAWLLLVAGHALWPLAAERLASVDLRPDAILLALLALGLWGASWTIPYFPLSLVLPLLALLTAWALRRGPRSSPAPIPRPRARALLATGMLPLAAVAAFTLTRDLPDWEPNVWALVLLGGPATALWLNALVRDTGRD